METITDIASLKSIPGFQSIMKVIVKNLIQTLIEQLSAHTDEECVILTASVQDATISQFGSQSGQTFLKENEELTSQFVRFCQKRFSEENSVPEHLSNTTTITRPECDLQAVSKDPIRTVKHKGKSTRKRKPKEKYIATKKRKTVATENLYKKKRLISSTVASNTTEHTVSETNTPTPVCTSNDTIKQEHPETDNNYYTADQDLHPESENNDLSLDQGLANIVQSTEGVPPIDISSLKLETVDDIIEIQLADQFNNDGDGDTDMPCNEGQQGSVPVENMSPTVISSPTTSKKNKRKSRAEIQRAYRERLKEKDRDAFYAKERERQKGYYTPSRLLPPNMREELKRKRREYTRQYRQRKKIGFVSLNLLNSKH